MKAFSLIATPMLLLLLAVACKPSPPLTETTPKFYFPDDTVYTASGDTLVVQGTPRNGFTLSALKAGDTVEVRVDIDGVFHPLAEVCITLSSDTAAEALPPLPTESDSLFLPGSDFAAGQYLVSEGHTRIPFTVRYHALLPDTRASLTLTARSLAPAGSDTASLTLRAPVK